MYCAPRSSVSLSPRNLVELRMVKLYRLYLLLGRIPAAFVVAAEI
jgi:hypothetical protein